MPAAPVIPGARGNKIAAAAVSREEACPARIASGWGIREARPPAPALRLQPGALAHAQRPRRGRRRPGGLLAGVPLLPVLPRRGPPPMASRDRPQRVLDVAAGEPSANPTRTSTPRTSRSRRRASAEEDLLRRADGARLDARARGASRRVPRGRDPARARGALVPRDRGRGRNPRRHRDVAPRTGAAPPAERARAARGGGGEAVSCAGSRERIHAWLDGELSVEAALEAESHARTCAECAAAYRSAVALREAFRGAGLTAVPPDSLEARVRAGLATEGRSRRDPACRSGRRPRPRSFSERRSGCSSRRCARRSGRADSTRRSSRRTCAPCPRPAHRGRLVRPAHGQAVVRGQDRLLPEGAGPRRRGVPAEGRPPGSSRAPPRGRARVRPRAAQRGSLRLGRVDSRDGDHDRERARNQRREVDGGGLAYAAVSDVNETELVTFANLVRR